MSSGAAKTVNLTNDAPLDQVAGLAGGKQMLTTSKRLKDIGQQSLCNFDFYTCRQKLTKQCRDTAKFTYCDSQYHLEGLILFMQSKTL